MSGIALKYISIWEADKEAYFTNEGTFDKSDFHYIHYM